MICVDQLCGVSSTVNKIRTGGLFIDRVQKGLTNELLFPQVASVYDRFRRAGLKKCACVREYVRARVLVSGSTFAKFCLIPRLARSGPQRDLANNATRRLL